MTDFFVGQKIVCIDADLHLEWLVPARAYTMNMNGLTRGIVYTVRAVCDHLDGSKNCIKLAEIIRHPMDQPYSSARFRPVEYKAISVFRKIAQDVTDGKVLEIADV